MPIQRRSLTKLAGILGLLGADQPGERASAALAAHKFMASHGVSWAELLHPPEPVRTRVVVQRVRDYDLDHAAAADARMRQLRDTNERLERENRALRRRLAAIADRQRRERALAEEASSEVSESVAE